VAERLKKPLSRRIVPAIEGRKCVLNGFSGVSPAEGLKKPLSHRIIPAIERRQCLPERKNFLRLSRRLNGLRNYRLRLAFVQGAGS
jgi:hypothetical protein